MPPETKSEPLPIASKALKRKEPHQSSSQSHNARNRDRDPKRARLDSRSILTQKSDVALTNGELDLQAFLKSREFEIKALQDGMERSKSSRTTRAFQQVPRDLRRRTASHNVKRVPKRLLKRAKREMKEDNTPTVDPAKRKPGSSRGRIRAETAKKLGILAEKKRALKAKAGITTRPPKPKIRRDRLNDPPKPKSKFRKRQINKTWLPTHMWHAKRATMTAPKEPLWRFAIPLTSTEKSYRPTHRAGGAKGCVAWDMSYMSTILLEGVEASLTKVLKAVGITDSSMWEGKGLKWRLGKRSWSGWLTREIDKKIVQVSPATVLWCPLEPFTPGDGAEGEPKKPPKRRLFVRVHPAAFLEVWEELLNKSKQQRPAVHIEDLRFEIGSIDITGPGSTETLLGILNPFSPKNDNLEAHASAFKSVAGVTNPSSLPRDSLLAFSIFDPRLRYPPRPAQIPKPDDENANFKLLQMLSSWPIDSSAGSQDLFDANARYTAGGLPSQKALNRRKSLAKPGEYATVIDKDPPIPIILLTSRADTSGASQGTWTILAPWKCIVPIWHGVMHYPLLSGGNPRFGGLDELRQTHFEQGTPWFPADFPGTASGFAWETDQRCIKKAEWDRRPKGKRVEWDSLDLGAGRKGEIGLGWACDFDKILELNWQPETLRSDDTTQDTHPSDATPGDIAGRFRISHLPHKQFESFLSRIPAELPSISSISTVRITLLARGVAVPCARIYRLPATIVTQDSVETTIARPTTREEWLALLPSPNSKNNPHPKAKERQKIGRIPLNAPLSKRVQMIARSLLQPPPELTKEGDNYPVVPDEEDLIGFVTTGSFNLAEGKGVAIGSVCVAKVLEALRDAGKKQTKEGRICIVRNAGEKMGRLAKWEPV